MFSLFNVPTASVVDPDPEKNHSGSEQLRIWNEFEVKLLWKSGKIWLFLNKNAKLKNTNSLLSKKSPQKPYSS